MSCTCEQLEAKLTSIESMLNTRLATLESRVQALEDRLNALENTPIDITQAVKDIFGVS